MLQSFPSACSGPEFIEGKPFKSLTEEELEPEVAAKRVLSLVEKNRARKINSTKTSGRWGAMHRARLFAREEEDKPWDKLV